MPPSTTLATALSWVRVSTGFSFLLLPQLSLTTFLIPQASAPAAVLATRLTGVRELALGELLWFSLRRYRAGSQQETGGRASDKSLGAGGAGAVEGSREGKQASLLGKVATGASREEAGRERERMVAYTLVAVMAADALDVMCCVVGVAEGSLPPEAALLVGGAACVAFGAGLLTYLRGPWRV